MVLRRCGADRRARSPFWKHRPGEASLETALLARLDCARAKLPILPHIVPAPRPIIAPARGEFHYASTACVMSGNRLSKRLISSGDNAGVSAARARTHPIDAFVAIRLLASGASCQRPPSRSLRRVTE